MTREEIEIKWCEAKQKRLEWQAKECKYEAMLVDDNRKWLVADKDYHNQGVIFKQD